LQTAAPLIAAAKKQFATLPRLLNEGKATLDYGLGGKPHHSAGGQEDRSPAPPPSAKLASSSAFYDTIRT